MVCDGNMNRKMAEVKLCVSYRTISRYIAGYRAYGKAFFQHGNFGKSSSKALSSDTKSLILDLYRDPSSPIFNANFAIVTEFLNMYKESMVNCLKVFLNHDQCSSLISFFKIQMKNKCENTL